MFYPGQTGATSGYFFFFERYLCRLFWCKMRFFIFPFVTFNLLILLGILVTTLMRIPSSSNSRLSPAQIILSRLVMTIDLNFALYFFLIADIGILLTPTYLLAVFELEKTIRNRIFGSFGTLDV